MRKGVFLLVAVLIGITSCNQKGQTTEDNEAKQENVTMELRDYGPGPVVFDMEEITLENENFRTTMWTGEYLQMTLMSLQPGEDIGLELHTKTDQFIRVEEGVGTVYMGDTEDNLDFVRELKDDFGFFIPSGKWHNLKNTGNKPLKLYSIYAPAEHAHGTVHVTREEGIEHDHDH